MRAGRASGRRCGAARRPRRRASTRSRRVRTTRPCWPARRDSRGPACRARRAARGAPRRAADTTRTSGRTGRRRRSPGLLTGQERRQVALVELGRPVQRRLRPDRLQVGTEGGAPQQPVGLLERVRRRCVPPHHEVGVGAQAGHVVGAPHDDVLGRELLEEGVDLVGQVGRAAPAAARDLEHRPHRVAEVALSSRIRAALVCCRHDSVLAPILAERRSAAAWPLAHRPAIPTPSYAAPARASRSAAARPGRWPPGPRWPGAYCGSAATPPAHPGLGRRRQRLPDQRAQLSVGESGQRRVVALQRCLVAVPAQRGPDDAGPPGR